MRQKSWPEFLIAVPGVQKGSTGDNLGQTYVAPEDAVVQGADLIIVGRGIYSAQNPQEEACDYAKRGFATLMSVQSSAAGIPATIQHQGH